MTRDHNTPLTVIAGLILIMAPVANLADSNSDTHSETQASQTSTVRSNSIAADAPLPDGIDAETGFRMERYRAPVPDSLPGAETVNTQRAKQLQQSGQVVFIDVYPPRGLGADPLDGRWLTSETRENIENSVWLPEVGRGYLESEHIDYFQRNLARLDNGDQGTAFLFYCTADCWQSWNAARRALLWGYNNIFWYPDGTDGWAEENLPVVTAEPVNFHGE